MTCSQPSQPVLKAIALTVMVALVVLSLSGCLGNEGEENYNGGVGATEESEESPGDSGVGSRDTEPTGDQDGDDLEDSQSLERKSVNATTDYRPRVIVGIPDTGLNPYHEIFYRPELTDPPCTYLKSFPCGLEELPLSVGGDDWEAAMKKDEELLKSMKEGMMYWIPQTVFVAVTCQEPQADHEPDDKCLTDFERNHGTGVAGSVLMENPDALVAYVAGNSWISPLEEAGIPIDIHSVSWGHGIPFPVPNIELVNNFCISLETSPIYVTAAGNDPRLSPMDCWSGHPQNIAVGGAFPPDEEHWDSAKSADVVSYFCRPVPHWDEMNGDGQLCGTSAAAPTVAGGLSKVIYGLREASGYTGGIEGDYVDPILGVTVGDLRDAMNRTATYTPESQYDYNPYSHPIPLIPVAPWLQWGWGFYDGFIANATLAHLLGTEVATEKPEEAQFYMESIYTFRKLMYGESEG